MEEDIIEDEEDYEEVQQVVHHNIDRPVIHLFLKSAMDKLTGWLFYVPSLLPHLLYAAALVGVI